MPTLIDVIKKLGDSFFHLSKETQAEFDAAYEGEMASRNYEFSDDERIKETPHD